MEPNKQPRSFRLDQETTDGLKTLGAHLHRSQAEVIELLIRERLAQIREADLAAQVRELQERVRVLEERG